MFRDVHNNDVIRTQQKMADQNNTKNKRRKRNFGGRKRPASSTPLVSSSLSSLCTSIQQQSIPNVIKREVHDIEHVNNQGKWPIRTSKVEFEDLEGAKGCLWSPDGSCLLTSKSSVLRMFELDSENLLKEAVTAREAELVYDYSWFPNMDSTRPETCCFASISQSSPIHLWDAYQTACLRASYTLQSAQNEPVWGLSLGMTSTQIFCGLKSAVYIWNIERPGLPLQRVPSVDRNGRGTSGLVSCFAFSEDESSGSCHAIGSYSGQVAIFSPQQRNRVVWQSKAQPNGVTRVKYSDCGRYLWAGGRRSSSLMCWDMRMADRNVFCEVPRICKSNQRIEFDVWNDDEYGMVVASGNSVDGKLNFWSIQGPEPEEIPDHCLHLPLSVNGVSLNRIQRNLLAVSTGKRVSSFLDSDSEDEHKPTDIISSEKGGISVFASAW